LEVTLSFILAPVSFLFLWTALPACPRVVMASYLNPDAPKDSQDLWEEGEEVEKVKCWEKNPPSREARQNRILLIFCLPSPQHRTKMFLPTIWRVKNSLKARMRRRVDCTDLWMNPQLPTL